MAFLLAVALWWMVSSAEAKNDYRAGENVALQGRSTQSSTYLRGNLGYLGNSINAIDGNLDTNYYHGSCTCTHKAVSPWWRVDLLKPHKISHIIITNRGDCCGERLNGAQILIGDSLQNNGNNNPRCAQISRMSNGATQSFQCNGMIGRYVNIVLPRKNTYLHLCEVQVFGVPTSNNCCYPV